VIEFKKKNLATNGHEYSRIGAGAWQANNLSRFGKKIRVHSCPFVAKTLS
jgi:hypothetical protein